MFMPKSAQASSTIKQFEKLNRTRKGINLWFNRLRKEKKWRIKLLYLRWGGENFEFVTYVCESSINVKCYLKKFIMTITTEVEQINWVGNAVINTTSLCLMLILRVWVELMIFVYIALREEKNGDNDGNNWGKVNNTTIVNIQWTHSLVKLILYKVKIATLKKVGSSVRVMGK